ncbi:MAG: hypothetical protein V4726_07330 [Verrucomicrobiota bacterium]
MTITDAFLAARGRGVLPTALASRDARLAFAREVRRRAVFSARTTSLIYLSIMRDAVESLLMTEQHGVSIGQAEVRLRLKQALEALHYDPENGHFGTPQDSTVPPARPGSIQDLSSDRRLNLIIDTQRMLYQSAAQNARAKEPISLRLFPCWELRSGYARAPRADWQARWVKIGGTLYEGRMIAPVGDPIWSRLGNGQTFDDALDTETPPFAFGSTRRWRGVSRDECLRLGVPVSPAPEIAPEPAAEPPAPGPEPEQIAPAPVPENPVPAPVAPPTPAPVAPPAPEPVHELPTPKATIPEDANPTVVQTVSVTLKVSLGDDDTEEAYQKLRAERRERVRRLHEAEAKAA